MPAFLTVKEAAELTGKSPSSIRRIIYPILQDEKHPDRAQIRPSPEEALQLRLKGENFAWRLSEELLRREIPVGPVAEKTDVGSAQRPVGNEGSELLSMLRRELEIKNGQITQQSELISKQMELISGLSERLREGNMLIGSLQHRLAMPDEKPKTSVDATEVTPAAKSAVVKEKGTKPGSKQPKPKKGFLARLFK